MFKKGSRKINTHQKEQQRNKKEIQRAKERDDIKSASQAVQSCSKIGKRGFITAQQPGNIKESI